MGDAPHHHGDKGTDVALLHDELEHRHHGVHFDTPLLLPAPLLLKLFFLIIVFLLLIIIITFFPLKCLLADIL